MKKRLFTVMCITAIMIISCVFATGASAWDKVFFEDDFTSYTPGKTLFGASDKWTDFRDRGFTQWTPMIITDPADTNNQVLALDKNTESASTKNEHLTALQETINGQIECSLNFYIPSAVTKDGIAYNAVASDEKITVGAVSSANAASFLVYSYIIPNASGGSEVYSHGQTKIVSKDAWHTLRMTVNTETGKRETYIDGETLYSSDVITDIEGKSMSEFRISVSGTLPETLAYVDDVKVKKTDGVLNYKIKCVQYTDGNVFLKTPNAGASLKEIAIEKADSADGNGAVVAAYFDKNNKMTAVKLKSFSLEDFDENGEAVLLLNMPFPENSSDVDGGKLKVFMWDSKNRVSPFTDSYTSESIDAVPAIYLAGDSTMETYTDRDYPRAGIGQMLGDYFEGVEVVNHGSSGKTTADFLAYTGWTEILENAKSGDYVVIQLGINDALQDVGTDVYYENLTIMTDALLEKGVNVIVNTPTIRRMFADGRFRATFDEEGNFISTDVYTFAGGDYLETVKTFISERENDEGFFSVDMTKIAAEMIGPNAAFDDSSRRYYMQDAYYNWDSVYALDSRAEESRYADKSSNNYLSCASDHTHLTIYGASVTAQKMAQAISELNIPLSDYVVNLDKGINYPDGLSEDGIVISTDSADMALTASSQLEENTVANLSDSNPLTYWEAGERELPEDKGLNLMVSKEETGSDSFKVSYSFTPETKLLILEQDVLATDTFGEKALPYFYSSDGDIALTTVITDSRMVVTGSTIVSEVEPDTWYHLKYVMNIGAHTCDVYLNGELKLNDKSFREDVADISKIQYHITGGNTGTFYVDNVKITVGNENNEPILSEDFEDCVEGASLPDGWTQTTGSSTGIAHYIPADGPKYPQRVVLDLKRIGYLEAAEVVFPQGHFYKFEAEVSKDGRAYTHIAMFDDKYYGGKVRFSFSPVAARYFRIKFLGGQDNVPAAMSEINVWWQKKTPVENLAFTADVQASSENSSAYDKRGINDNIIASFEKIGEWRPAENDSSPWVEMKWNEEKTVDRIVLYGSAQLDDNIKKGTLTFSDGSSMEVTDIPASGKPLILDFEAKTVSWIRFTITEYEGAAALSEMQVYPVGEKPELIEYIEPWKVVTINEDYASKWLVSADIDNDGEAELVSCRSQYDQYHYDNHEVRTACAMELDGSLIWTWGTAGEGVTTMGADSPCQVYDIDNDGVMEVLLCTKTELVILNAQTGKEEKRHTLPVGQTHPDEWATDCIIIANISGGDYPSDIIIKSRYHEAWAYTKDWELIWHISMPGGMNIGHQPLPVDIDNDGYDEVLVGYSLVNPDGSYRWIMDKDEYLSNLSAGHSDSVKLLNYYVVGDVDENGVINQNDVTLLERIIGREATAYQLRAGDTNNDGTLTSADADLIRKRISNEIKSFPNKGAKAEDIRICLCLCGACDIVMIDGNGKRIWAEEDGMHYETIMTGKLIEGSDETQIVSNPNFPQWMNSESGNQPVFIHDIDGNLLKAQFGIEWNRKLSVINWSGGADYIYLPADGVMVDINMNIKARTLSPVRGHDSAMAYATSRGDTAYRLDFNGDGRQDLANLTDASGKVELYIYLNENGKIVADGIGSGYNVTFY